MAAPAAFGQVRGGASPRVPPLEELAVPACPGCGRLASAWYSVPLCGRCRSAIAAHPRPCQLAALRLVYARPASPPGSAAAPAGAARGCQAALF